MKHIITFQLEIESEGDVNTEELRRELAKDLLDDEDTNEITIIEVKAA